MFNKVTNVVKSSSVRGMPSGPSWRCGATKSIQGRASRFVTRIEGSYTNVVGLPVELVDGLLRELAGGGSPDAAEPASRGPDR